MPLTARRLHAPPSSRRLLLRNQSWFSRHARCRRLCRCCLGVRLIWRGAGRRNSAPPPEGRRPTNSRRRRLKLLRWRKWAASFARDVQDELPQAGARRPICMPSRLAETCRGGRKLAAAGNLADSAAAAAGIGHVDLFQFCAQFKFLSLRGGQIFAGFAFCTTCRVEPIEQVESKSNRNCEQSDETSRRLGTRAQRKERRQNVGGRRRRAHFTARSVRMASF